ncbi:hypothetical protein SKTS_00510 [Sulfurimicrobium lacus]|uniref:Thioredoxin domain-containing protein n=1 Tax=Sulfurimicrobium lacus TaxID=2715678 RepID=A0A6F8V8R1_9PROT|nr:TlpA disulfide reductase family protein [Sulfurimicrobium lacus]BCB25165.1 hypothetical protein SKTS_00510 [Sulfurimicrobium lacus]
MNMRRTLGFILIWIWAYSAQAASPAPRPFVPGSMKEVASAHAGKPFILAFWSLSCIYCKANLEQLGKLLEEYPQLPLVLVSTDTVEESAAIAAVLDKYGLGQAQSWVFADSFVERLHFEIDRRWRGELPHTYFYGATHQARVVSGKLDEAETVNWIKREVVR